MPEPAPLALPRLERGVVHVYWFATDLATTRQEELAPLLDPGERARAERFHFPRDRGRFVAAHATLRTILGLYTEQAPDRLEFDTGPYGKPALRLAAGAPPLRFNLSRSAGIGVVGIGLVEELGIDVERVRPLEDGLAIAEQMFTEEEHRALRAIPERDQPAAFFRYWTRKEAVVKSLGLGLSHPLDAFSLSPGSVAAQCVELAREGASTVCWILPVPALREGCVAALATTAPPPSVHCWDWPGT
jgi:4'-phosphopantetheinyl transferase